MEKDLIYRKVVLALLRGWPLADTDARQLIEVVESIAPVQTQAPGPVGDGWIRINGIKEDTLPQGAFLSGISENVNVYTVDGEVLPGWLNGTAWYLMHKMDTTYTKHGFDYVTHWQPLPQPPKKSTPGGESDFTQKAREIVDALAACVKNHADETDRHCVGCPYNKYGGGCIIKLMCDASNLIKGFLPQGAKEVEENA